MLTSSKRRYDTLQVHGEENVGERSASCSTPIDPSASFRFYTSEEISEVYSGRKTGFSYSRFTNPTVEVFEKRMAALEKGQSAVAVASGAAAVLMTVMALAKAGDNIVSCSKIYNGTFTQFQRLLPSFGVTTKFVDPSLTNLKEMIDKNTKLVFCESVANPDFSVANYSPMVQTAHDAGIPVVVDATFTAAGFFGNPIDFGVDIVVHSATKWISGHGTTFGGVVVDSGKFDWSLDAARFPQFHTVQGIVDQQSPATFWNRFGSRAFTAYLKYNLQRDVGSTLSPFSAQQLLIGLETLSLRCERQVKNAATLAKWLRSRQQVAWVAYIGFEDHPAHEMARRYLTNGFCSVLTFGLVGGQKAAFRLIDNFKLIVNSSNVGDSKTIVGHPWSTTHMSMTVEERVSCGVTDDMIRISSGTEDVGDIIDDISQSLEKLDCCRQLSNGNVKIRVVQN
ncbi:Homocysteine/cysteine synthase [Xanthoria calcicola]